MDAKNLGWFGLRTLEDSMIKRNSRKIYTERPKTNNPAAQLAWDEFVKNAPLKIKSMQLLNGEWIATLEDGLVLQQFYTQTRTSLKAARDVERYTTEKLVEEA
jgi:hypothetical protein